MFLVPARVTGYLPWRYSAATPADALEIAARGAYQQLAGAHTSNQLLVSASIKG